MSNKAKF